MKNISNEHVIRKINKNNKVASKSKTNVAKNINFNDVLSKVKKQGKVKFSKHALNRLEKRNIQLSSEQIEKIDKAIEKASSKGITEALIMMNDKAFVASIKNKTIITASTNEQLKDKVFTNIDGAVIT